MGGRGRGASAGNGRSGDSFSAWEEEWNNCPDLTDDVQTAEAMKLRHENKLLPGEAGLDGDSQRCFHDHHAPTYERKYFSPERVPYGSGPK